MQRIRNLYQILDPVKGMSEGAVHLIYIYIGEVMSYIIHCVLLPDPILLQLFPT